MIYAIGDIHGHLQKLLRLMEQIQKRGLSDTDRLVFLGDYVDRGPDIPELLDYLIGLRALRPNTVFLRGNHDQGMLDALSFYKSGSSSNLMLEDVSWWFSCGGLQTIESYEPAKTWYEAIPQSHWDFLGETTLQYEEGGYLFVHAGVVPPGQKWREKVDPRLWIREQFIGSLADFGKTVVFGHTPMDLHMPCVMRNKVGIDTGAAYGGPLTALRLDPAQRYNMDSLDFLSSKGSV